MSNRPTPHFINECRVIETGSFAEARLPTGYLPPPDGRPPLHPVRHVALGVRNDVDGYYTIFCSETWEYVTCVFNETLEHAKRSVIREFGVDVTGWQYTPAPSPPPPA